MHRKFGALSETDIAELRQQIRRLAARLRSRAALRMKRASAGRWMPRKPFGRISALPASPSSSSHKLHHQKPKLVIICDVSTSVRPAAEFMLRLVYELQDQISKARPFVFIDDIYDIGAPFTQYRPEVAVELVLSEHQPGYYNTNLGPVSPTLLKTTSTRWIIARPSSFSATGATNYLNPRLDAVDLIKKRARKLLWFNPEDPRMWGTGDSDMLEYQPHFDAVHEVSNLAQLADAIDRLFDLY